MSKKATLQSAPESFLRPIDVHVGSRIRLRRSLVGASVDALGGALGLSYQQVLKYERGVNRVGASRLFDISRILGVPVSFFFDDLPKSTDAAPISGPCVQIYDFAEAQERFSPGEENLNRRETQDVVRAYYCITDPAVRMRVFELIKSLAPAEQ